MMDINRQKRGIILISLDLVSIVSQSHAAFSSTGLVFFTKFGCGSWVSYQRFA